MSPQSESSVLLLKVQRRLTAVRLARQIHCWLLGALACACVTVLVVRLLGLLPETQQNLLWLASFPLAGIAGGWLFFRRVEQVAAARVVDQHARTDDLFLTLATLETSAGEYQPLVAHSADQVAPRIVAEEVVPFRPQRSVGFQAIAVIALALLVWFLPTLDPLGRVEAATKVEKQKKEITDVLKAVKARSESLQKEVKAAEDREQKIDSETKELMHALRKMKPKEKKANSQVLLDHRRELNELWKSVSSDDLRQMLSQSVSEQQFGGEKSQKMNEWLKDLQQGKADSLQQELQKAQQTMESMLKAETPEEREKLASELRKQIQELKKFSMKKAGTKPLENALSRALKSLENLAEQQKKAESGDPQDPEAAEGENEMSKEAAEALRESLEQAKKELEEVARSAKDMKELEEAIKTLQEAEKLNQGEQMDGEQCEGCQSLEEYADMLRKMGGMGQNGNAEREQPGSMMDEDNGDPEGYKDEKSKAQIQAGKVLLSIKSKDAATEKDFDPEELRKFESSVQEVKNGVQSAIESEQIPPGYVDGIKKYFDSIPTPSTAPANP